jgi:hypothetical protein
MISARLFDQIFAELVPFWDEPLNGFLFASVSYILGPRDRMAHRISIPASAIEQQ